MAVSGYFTNPANQYWIGGDGNVYIRTSDGVINAGTATRDNQAWVNAVGNGITAKKIDDPLPGGAQSTVSGNGIASGGGSTADAKAAQDAIDRANLKSEIKGHAGQVDQVYNDLFGNLDNVLRSRDAQLESQYGDQLKSASDKYAEALPQIDTSYASIGSGDSTDKSYAKVGAKKGFEDTTATIGKNKADDKSKLGQYGNEQRAKIQADLDTAHQNLGRVDSTTDVDSLRSMRDQLDTNLSTAGVTKATLGTDGQASRDLSSVTADNGRYDAAVNALDGILKSSLSGGVKQAAVQAVTNSAGLSDEEKKKVQTQFGNVYAEQAAL